MMDKSVSLEGVHLITCVGVDQEYELLPHFIEHYLSLGLVASRCHVVLNAAKHESPNLSWAEALLNRHGFADPVVWIAPYTSETMWEQRRAIQRERVGSGDWVVSADADEFHDYGMSLANAIRLCEEYSADCLQGVFIDRVTSTGNLAALDGQTSIWDQFPVMADIQNHIVERRAQGRYYGTIKMMLFRGHVMPGRGGHQPPPGERNIRYLFRNQLAELPGVGKSHFRFSVPFRVHHFKWRDSLIPGLERRLATAGVSAAGEFYGSALLAYFAANNKIRLRDMPILEFDERMSPSEGVTRLRRLAQFYNLVLIPRRLLGTIRKRLTRWRSGK